ncbi:MAG TPA: cysteine desulfurase [candidate division Zixibacteria bacterium]|nr:cysteine desulfurase [candidate division Zixibacteria bacterium]
MSDTDTKNRTSKLDNIKAEFPELNRVINSKPVVFLDSAATSQKPMRVIDKLVEYYSNYNANVHRGVYSLSMESTEEYDTARELVREFINARSTNEIIYTRGTTEAINLLARSWGDANIGKDDEIILTELEHHSNLVPWQMLSQRTGCKLRFIPVDDFAVLLIDEYKKLLSEKTKLVAFNGQSNSMGTLNPIKEITALAHDVGALVLVDGAQYVPHNKVDVRDLDVDFLAFSGHKMCGPTGIGILYGREKLLDEMPPFLGGGDMIDTVHYEYSTYTGLPIKFEAGTPNIAGAIVLGEAIRFLNDLGMENIRKHEYELTAYTMQKLQQIPKIKIYGTTDLRQRGGAISFEYEGIHPHDLAQILDSESICIRAGHHCTQPLMRKFGIAATSRASFYIYNTREDVDRLMEGLAKADQIFGL